MNGQHVLYVPPTQCGSGRPLWDSISEVTTVSGPGEHSLLLGAKHRRLQAHLKWVMQVPHPAQLSCTRGVQQMPSATCP